MHRNPLDAAAAATAAQRQGKFWEYHEALLQARGFDRDSLLSISAALGLDRDTFLRDLDDPAIRSRLAAGAREARDAGALGTPAFSINGRVEVGRASLPWLEQKIRSASRLR